MFWRFNVISSNIDSLLENEGVTLQEIMDEDDVLSECKANNTKLVSFLCKTDVMEQMIDLVTKEPAEDVEDKVKYKYPNTACELLTSDLTAITEKLAEPEMLDRLYGFLSSEERHLNPLLASFVSKVMGLLIIRNGQYLLSYLRNKEDFVGCLLSHMETSAIMDLLTRLATGVVEPAHTKQQVLEWLDSERTVERLVSLIHPSQSNDAHCNASQVLCELVRNHRDLAATMGSSESLVTSEEMDGDRLVIKLESESVLSTLLSNMLDEEKSESVLTNGLQVLHMIAIYRRPMPLEGTPEQPNGHEAIVLRGAAKRILVAVRPRLEQLAHLLTHPPAQRYSVMPTTTGTLDPPLGCTRLLISHLLADICSYPDRPLVSELIRVSALNDLLGLFFEYKLNNFLHCQVELCLSRLLLWKQSEDFFSVSSPTPAGAADDGEGGHFDSPSQESSPPTQQPLTDSPPAATEGQSAAEAPTAPPAEDDDEETGGESRGAAATVSVPDSTLEGAADAEVTSSGQEVKANDAGTEDGGAPLDTSAQEDGDGTKAEMKDEEDSSSVDVRRPLIVHVFKDCLLIRRILDGWEDSEASQSSRPRHRSAFMGHLTKIANHVADYLGRLSAEERLAMEEVIGAKDVEDWKAFSSQMLARENKRNRVEEFVESSGMGNEEDGNIGDIPFTEDPSAQQAFADFQVQQITTNFIDQFGFNEENFDDPENRIDAPFENNISSINFSTEASEESASNTLFEKAAFAPFQTFDSDYRTRQQGVSEGDDEGEDRGDTTQDLSNDWVQRTLGSPTAPSGRPSAGMMVGGAGESRAVGRAMGGLGSPMGGRHDDSTSSSSSDSSEEDLAESPRTIRQTVVVMGASDDLLSPSTTTFSRHENMDTSADGMPMVWAEKPAELSSGWADSSNWAASARENPLDLGEAANDADDEDLDFDSIREESSPVRGGSQATFEANFNPFGPKSVYLAQDERETQDDGLLSSETEKPGDCADVEMPCAGAAAKDAAQATETAQEEEAMVISPGSPGEEGEDLGAPAAAQPVTVEMVPSEESPLSASDQTAAEGSGEKPGDLSEPTDSVAEGSASLTEQGDAGSGEAQKSLPEDGDVKAEAAAAGGGEEDSAGLPNGPQAPSDKRSSASSSVDLPSSRS